MIRHLRAAPLAAWILLIGVGFGFAQEPAPPVPAAEELEAQLAEKPISRETWPFWRERFLSWYYDRTDVTEPLDKALEKFIAGEAQADEPVLPDWLAEDPAAWLLLGRSLLDGDSDAGEMDPRAAESAFRRSLELDENLAAAHSNLAGALIVQALDMPEAVAVVERSRRLAEAEREIEAGARLSEDFRPAHLRGMLAFARGQYGEAERLFRQAVEDHPHSEGAAIWLLQSAFAQEGRAGQWAELSGPLVERLPEKGRLRVFHALALVRDHDLQAAAEQIGLARTQGADPEAMLGAETVARIERMAQSMTPAFRQGLEALDAGRHGEARQHLRAALREQPENVEIALALVQALLAVQGPSGSGGAVSAEIEDLRRRFPREAAFPAMLAVALAREGEFAEAVAALDRAEALGADLDQLLGPEAVGQIRQAGEPSLLASCLWGMAYFAIAYACIIALMAVAGAVLSAATPRVPAVEHAAKREGDLISSRESFLARVYVLTLMIGLLLFYVSIPFVVAGLLGLTGGILLLMFMAPVISIKLVIIVVIIGLGMGWAVLKSVFASHGGATFGVKKTAQECPRLHAAIAEVAQKTATDPIDDVYIAPGSAIGVYQEGRGPFGVLGVKRRVLTLGLSTMHYLTVSELKAILAHEYAHFSHRDTFYSRFVHQVTLSIENALTGMGQYGGSLNYVNPFFWFFWLYYKAYSLLASGFSRSREFLADRMAVSLYGKNAFVSGLTKVATDGAFFEASMYQNISSLLSQGKAFVNMYEAFRAHREEGISPEEREQLYTQMLEEKSSLFDTHPTFPERVRATIDYPDIPQAEQSSALQLFDDPDALEREMTEYLTGYLYTIQQLQAQAAAEA